ncbi:hypothetical protein NE237_004286 [Protea cynaroides]|uniref:Uncharacterized protein n=1 Tax=Protea cynaroides TaxID=273540 RepID=A0A9Q0QTF9_9MAGN|nr:hypothetical protein NE237_004286 [Protea cynaroides]
MIGRPVTTQNQGLDRVFRVRVLHKEFHLYPIVTFLTSLTFGRQDWVSEHLRVQSSFILDLDFGDVLTALQEDRALPSHESSKGKAVDVSEATDAPEIIDILQTTKVVNVGTQVVEDTLLATDVVLTENVGGNNENEATQRGGTTEMEDVRFIPNVNFPASQSSLRTPGATEELIREI